MNYDRCPICRAVAGNNRNEHEVKSLSITRSSGIEEKTHTGSAHEKACLQDAAPIIYFLAENSRLRTVSVFFF